MRNMFDHERLRVYQEAIEFVAWEVTTPSAKNFTCAYDHLTRASASVPVNIAEASGKYSEKERRQFIDTAYGSSLECAACLDILNIMRCLSAEKVHEGKKRLSTIVSMLIGFRQSTERKVCDEREPYTTGEIGGDWKWFDHEKLDVYQKALAFVRWHVELAQSQHAIRSVEKMVDKAAAGIVLNIAEGNGKFSIKDRCRFIGHARTSALQAAATLDVFAIRNGEMKQCAITGKRFLVDVVRMLVAWQRKLTGQSCVINKELANEPT